MDSMRVSGGVGSNVSRPTPPSAETIIEAVLLFHEPVWTEAKRARWLALTHREDATTRALCTWLRTARSALQSAPSDHE